MDSFHFLDMGKVLNAFCETGLRISECPASIKHHSKQLLYGGIAGGSMLLFPSCSIGSGSDDSEDSVAVSTEESAVTDDEFVVTTDIGMTVRSVADAINVGEKLDSAEYQFQGVLTDGSGMPLFTDFSGLPGQWQIEVLGPDMVRIRNTNSGDLLPEELVQYLAESLTVIDRNEVKFVEEKDEGDSTISVFSFGRGNLKVKTRPMQLSTGETGPLMEITIQADSIGRGRMMNVPQDSVEQHHRVSERHTSV